MKWFNGGTWKWDARGRVARWNQHNPVTKGKIIHKAAGGSWRKALSPESWGDVLEPFTSKGLSTGLTPLSGSAAYALSQAGMNHLRGRGRDCE